MAAPPPPDTEELHSNPPTPPSSKAPTCGVCYEPIPRGNNSRLLPCGHNDLCVACVEAWLREQRSDVDATCPYCRAEVTFVETPAGRRGVEEFYPDDQNYIYCDCDEYTHYDSDGESLYMYDEDSEWEMHLVSQPEAASGGFVVMEQTVERVAEQIAGLTQQYPDWRLPTPQAPPGSPASQIYGYDLNTLATAALEVEGGARLPREDPMDVDVEEGRAGDGRQQGYVADGSVSEVRISEEDAELVAEFPLNSWSPDSDWEFQHSER